MSAPPKTKLTMYEALIVCYLNDTIDGPSISLLSVWLDCRQYILPADRIETSNGALCKALISRSWCSSKQEVRKLWLALDLIESSLTIESQQRILAWTPD